MVEFDIVLTKDKIPIVYHDFVFCIDQLSSNADKKQQQQQQQDENTNPTTNTNTKSQSNNNLLSLAVNMLTYDEVKQNRVRNYKNRKKSSIIIFLLTISSLLDILAKDSQKVAEFVRRVERVLHQ